MPCYSRITTKLNNADNLAAALVALGYAVNRSDSSRTVAGTLRGDSITFQRNNSTDAFFAAGDTSNLAAISRKYAEVGVRQWATRKGFNILANDGVRLTLVNRRGF